MLSEEYLTKFSKLMRELYGVELSREEAYEQATKLLELVKVVYRPMTEEEFRKTIESIKDKDESANEPTTN